METAPRRTVASALTIAGIEPGRRADLDPGAVYEAKFGQVLRIHPRGIVGRTGSNGGDILAQRVHEFA